ncbi:MAG: hypothetical protein DRP09_15575 [Candidatus Thorarchaeota archaeon]|nr:MAG: hypothetical protein DRP09_15575 [Candidatus Thorarchaeota archaeon]
MRMRKVYGWTCWFLRRKGFSYKEIGELLGIPKGTAWRMVKKYPSCPFYFEKINSKKEKKTNPVWKEVSPDWVFSFIRNLSFSMFPGNRNLTLSLQDYLLDFLLTLDISKIKNKKGYLFKALLRKKDDFLKSAYFKYEWVSLEEAGLEEKPSRETVMFNFDKYK